MSFSRPIHWYHAYADPIWQDNTFNKKIKMGNRIRIESMKGTEEEWMEQILKWMEEWKWSNEI